MFEGERINLRAQQKEDIDLMVQYQADEDVTNNYYMSVNIAPTRDSFERWHNKAMSNKEDFTFAIETKEGLYIGGCHIMWLNWKNRTCYFAIYIGHPDYRSKGYGTEALKLLLNYIFNELGLRKVKLNVFSYNKRAIRSYEKCGFRVDGINKKELYRYGEYHDNIAMSITSEEFNRGEGHV